MARKKKVVEAEPKIGHNGGPINDERKKQLAGYVSEIERWEGEKATIQADIGLIFNAAKDAGFDTKAMRVVIKDRKKSRAEREAFEAVCDAYKHALGMLADLPLGQASMPRQEATTSAH
jgi:uncharacterized protein (UPF0335 family)